MAFAVRASCSIPFFFQPAQQFVDGGVISNIPAFVFDQENKATFKKVLAFSLESNINNHFNISSFTDFITAFTDSTIEGAKELQLELQKEVHLIKINTGDIKSTDFDKIGKEVLDFLIFQGNKAAKDFFDDEVLNIRTSAKNSNICSSYFQTYEAIAQTVESNIEKYSFQNLILIGFINYFLQY